MSAVARGRLTLFFDLDGTLSDPREGITRSVQYALERLGRPVVPRSELIQFIGPPLRWTFPRLLDTDDKELVEAAIRYYRERYEDTGLFENEVYPGIPELLRQLHGDGYPMYVVTAKPKVYSDRIIRHFGLDRYFIEVYGPELNGRFDEKRELVGFILHERHLDPRRTVMIGDRASDIESGRAYGTLAIGVTYGFGALEEITAAKPDHICHSPGEIALAVRQ
ncbi:MAG: HAD hydrolase-like protein [Sedimentisphaerales bacterium]|nr:HAD hydrolase-like protein [Sedimentisphaerales bacterium]